MCEPFVGEDCVSCAQDCNGKTNGPADLDRRAMAEITGAVGPAVVLRAIFAELHRFEPAGPLPLSRRLRQVKICAETGALAGAQCPAIEEWFRPEHVPTRPCPLHEGPLHGSPLHEWVAAAQPKEAAFSEPFHVDLVRPTPGLRLAMDPRIPDLLELFESRLGSNADLDEAEWIIDDRPAILRQSASARWEWTLSRGAHRVRARVRPGGNAAAVETREVAFFVQ